MRRNSAFGPPAQSRLRLWWGARSPGSRINGVVVIGLGIVVVALLALATSRDGSQPSPLIKAARPELDAVGPLRPPSTVVVGNLQAVGAPTSPPDLSGTTTTTATSTTVKPAVARVT